MNTWINIPCHRAYLPQLLDCLDAIAVNSDVPLSRVVVVANGERPITYGEMLNDYGAPIIVIQYCGEWNMSKWWNLGLDHIAALEHGKPHNVLVLNADAKVQRGSVERLAEVLRERGLPLVAPDVHRLAASQDGSVFVNRSLQPGGKHETMPGFAFMLQGELDLRCDPQFRYWYNDDDLEWQARQRGGVGLVAGVEILHPPHGGGMDSMREQFAAEDLPKFVAKWGEQPW